MKSSSYRILERFMVEHPLNFLIQNDYYYFCWSFDCVNCKVHDYCNDNLRNRNTSIPCIESDEYEHFKINHPEYMI